MVTVETQVDRVSGLVNIFLPRLYFAPVLFALEGVRCGADAEGARVIDLPLKARTASPEQVLALGPSSKLEIDPAANPLADMNATADKD